MKTKIITLLQNLSKYIWSTIYSLCNVKLFTFLFLFHFSLFTSNLFSQSVGIGATAFTPDASAILDVSSTTQGALMPRMTTAQRDAINSPAEGLFIFNTTTKCFESYVNNAWNKVSCPAYCEAPAAPTEGTHTPSQTQIVWNWNAVSGATGYKWGTTNDYNAATDNSTNTTKTQTGLTCNNSNTSYVWAYNSCGNSTATTLTQTTGSCCTPASVSDGSLIKTTSCDGNYSVIKWTGVSGGSATWTVPLGVSQVEYLVVAGGGAGGYGNDGFGAGGGGGGGVLAGTNLAVSETETIIVGAGGVLQSGRGGSGGNSSLTNDGATILATGGGGGGGVGWKGENGTGCDGGSSGGGGFASGAPGVKTSSPVQGSNGGTGQNNVSPYSGAGGGGANAAHTNGGDGSPSGGGAGADGYSSSITGIAVVYGGGGGGYPCGGSYSSGVGGAGGGGKGAYWSPATNATAGTEGLGGGGGGGGYTLYIGAKGGSGVVIIRYLTP